jgi:23S rRNA (cytidine1920-2'-O)/16S rRNA (cytidine1409-2'-O)-methyltransferase
LAVRKPSEEIAADAVLRAEAAHPWVSRGGVKLAAALDAFRIDPEGRVCLDVGASTGGFTEVLLARGAARVYAVDVGHDQLHSRLRGRREIVSLEDTDVRALDARRLPETVDLIVIDVSFISLKLVLPAALKLARQPAQLVALIKPQFEAPRRALKKGIVRDPALQRSVCDDVAAVVASLGWAVHGIVASPILGGDGNAEFLLGAERR